MQIVVNGKERDVPQGATVSDLLRELDINPQVTAVARNSAIVRRDSYGDAALAEGDRIEIVTMVGGG